MTRSIRARFSKGVIEPLEEVFIEEGREITVTIKERLALPKKKDPLEATAGGWKDLIDADKLKRDIYADRLIRTRPGVKHEDFLPR